MPLNCFAHDPSVCAEMICAGPNHLFGLVVVVLCKSGAGVFFKCFDDHWTLGCGDVHHTNVKFLISM